MFGDLLNKVRGVSPLVHCITNYVTVNDVANVLLGAGASPVMSDRLPDAPEITAISSSLVLNIGTLNPETEVAMKQCAKVANLKKIPVVLDPVGAGATKTRTNLSFELIKDCKISCIRGNSSEILTLCGESGKTKGVDAAESDKTSSLQNLIDNAKSLALKYKTIVAISGKTDIVTDGTKTYLLNNGNPLMQKITGTGCQSTALVAAFLASNLNSELEAVAASLSLMAVAGEIAFNKKTGCGNSSYRNYIIDEICNMSAETLDRMVRYEQC